MNLRFSSAALADAETIREFIARDDPEAARRVIDRIGRTIELLRDFPGLGHKGQVPGALELLVPGLPYVVIYQRDAGNVGGIVVLRIYHVAQDRGVSR